jgi:hypothetical protein
VVAVILITTLAAIIASSYASFLRLFNPYVPVTLTSDRAGLVMESGAKVKFRGVQVRQVDSVNGGRGSVSLRLQLDPDAVKYVPANVDAKTLASTAFGARYLDLTSSSNPAGSASPLAPEPRRSAQPQRGRQAERRAASGGSPAIGAMAAHVSGPIPRSSTGMRPFVMARFSSCMNARSGCDGVLFTRTINCVRA